jgi:hypothetical protein
MPASARPLTRPSVRWVTRLAVVALVLGLANVLTGAPLSAGPAQQPPAGGIGLRILDVPVETKDDPRARLYIVDHLAPGTVVERRVEVANTTGSSQGVVLYAAAATIDDGTFTGAPGRTRNDLASWTSVNPGAGTVPAGGTTTALVTIAVPADAAPGEQYGVVWAEARSAPTHDRGIEQVSRVGIRLYVSVGPGGAPAADFEITALTAERSSTGGPVVSATVHNTGGRALDMTGMLALTNGPGGLSAGPFPAELGSTLATGDTESVRISLDERLPDGPWDAVVTLQSGLTERRAEATITFPANGAAAPVTITEESPGAPWALVIGVGAGLALLVAIGLLIRRRRGGPTTTAQHWSSAGSAVSKGLT